MPSIQRSRQVLKRIHRIWKPRSSRSEKSPSNTLDCGEPKTTTEPQSSFPFHSLPKALRQHVASFLSLDDLGHLVQTSDTMVVALDLEGVSSPLTDRASQKKSFKTCGTKQCFAIVFPKPEATRIHSMRFAASCNLVGGQYATFYVVEHELPTNQKRYKLKMQGSFDKRNVVATTNVFYGPFSMGFPVKLNKMYQLYVKTFSERECGIESELVVEDMILIRLGFGAHSTMCTSYQYEVKVPHQYLPQDFLEEEQDDADSLSDDSSYQSHAESMHDVEDPAPQIPPSHIFKQCHNMPSTQRLRQIIKRIRRKWKPRSSRCETSPSHTLDGELKTTREPKHRAAFQNLPKELKQYLASFLSPDDLEQLIQTSETMEAALGLEQDSSPITDRASQKKSFKTCGTKQCFAIVFPKPEATRIHSMRFAASCNLVGGQYATIYVVEHELPTNQKRYKLKMQGSFDKRNVVATTNVFYGPFSMGFPVKLNKMYQLYVKTFSERECGIESELVVEDMILIRLGFGAHSTMCTSYQYEVKVPRQHVPQDFLEEEQEDDFSSLFDDDWYQSDVEWMDDVEIDA